MLLLPIVHVLYIVGSFIAATVVNYLGFTGYATATIYEILGGKYKLLREFSSIWTSSIKSIWNIHVDSMEGITEKYDHYSGIPSGWNGRRYGLPVGPWQTVIGLVLALYGMVTVLLGATVIAVVKILPVLVYLVYQYTKSYLKIGSMNTKLGLIPFFLCGYVLLIGLVPVVVVLGTIGCLFAGLHCPWVGIRHDSLKYGIVEALNMISEIDKFSASICWGFRIFQFWKKLTFKRQRGQGRKKQRELAQTYWERFMAACIQSTAHLFGV